MADTDTKTPLEANGDTIAEIKALVDALPDAGSGGGDANPTAVSKAVNFIDFDGTIRYSYTLDEVAALTALPPLPSHDGLTCQGWNWTLADIKAIGREVTVGAVYITDDGKTRIYIHLKEGRTSPVLGCCPNGTVTVDWGDGTTPDTLTGRSTSMVKWTPTHNYAAPGDYVIKLTVSGTMGLYGSSSSNQYSGMLRYSSASDGRNRVYLNAIRKVEIGSGVQSIGNYAFYYCSCLSSITIPDSVTLMGMVAFNNDVSLSSITIPDGVTTIGASMFNYCHSLSNIAIPDGVTTIGSSALSNCYSLSSIAIPDSVTSIGSNALSNCYSLSSITIRDGVTGIQSGLFSNCYGMKFYDFTAATAVPTMTNTNAFSGIAADCEIRVPASLVDTWKAATNWASYADHIVGV